VEYWNYEPIAVHLNRLAKNSVKIAERVGKELRVVVEDHGVRLPYSCLKNVWPSLIHVIRNAVDHGLESPSERLAASKPIVGTITLSASIDGDLLDISISDDGQGINWDRVRQRAMSFGLEHHSQEHLVDALFHDGLSTSEMVTELSGRGVGLSAVRQACSQVNGTIAVESSHRLGTAFVFTFDLRQLSCVLASDDSEMPERATKSIGVANTEASS
jgi:chemotaxis protein histidine kinase CheA